MNFLLALPGPTTRVRTCWDAAAPPVERARPGRRRWGLTRRSSYGRSQRGTSPCPRALPPVGDLDGHRLQRAPRPGRGRGKRVAGGRCHVQAPEGDLRYQPQCTNVGNNELNNPGWPFLASGPCPVPDAFHVPAARRPKPARLRSSTSDIPARTSSTTRTRGPSTTGAARLFQGAVLWAETFGDAADQVGLGGRVGQRGQRDRGRRLPGDDRLRRRLAHQRRRLRRLHRQARPLGPCALERALRRPRATELFVNVVVGGDGFIVVAGSYTDNSIALRRGDADDDGILDGFVAKLDASGAPLLEQEPSTPPSPRASPEMAVDARGNVAVAGSFDASIDLGERGRWRAAARGAGSSPSSTPRATSAGARTLSATSFLQATGVAFDGWRRRRGDRQLPGLDRPRRRAGGEWRRGQHVRDQARPRRQLPLEPGATPTARVWPTRRATAWPWTRPAR